MRLAEDLGGVCRSPAARLRGGIRLSRSWDEHSEFQAGACLTVTASVPCGKEPQCKQAGKSRSMANHFAQRRF